MAASFALARSEPRRGSDRRAYALASALLPIRYIDKRDDDPVDFVIYLAIGPKTHVIPSAVGAVDFAADRSTRIFDQVVVFELMSKIRDWPTLVA